MKSKELELKQAGAIKVLGYCLINNDGYTFEKNKVSYDLRHVLNCYGCDVDYYTLSSNNVFKTFDTFNDAVEYIKTL